MRAFATGVVSKTDIGTPPLTQLSFMSTRPSRESLRRTRPSQPDKPRRAGWALERRPHLWFREGHRRARLCLAEFSILREVTAGK